MSEVNPYTQNGIRELEAQAQAAARHARNAAVTATLARVLAKGDLPEELDKLAEALNSAKGDFDRRAWAKKLRTQAERIRVALGRVTTLGQQE